jgi:hypothetical protein
MSMASIRSVTRWVVASLLTLTLGWGAVQQSVHHHAAPHARAVRVESPGLQGCQHHGGHEAVAEDPHAACHRFFAKSGSSRQASSHECPARERRHSDDCAICRFLMHQAWDGMGGLQFSAAHLVWTEPVEAPRATRSIVSSGYSSRAPPSQHVSQV